MFHKKAQEGIKTSFYCHVEHQRTIAAQHSILFCSSGGSSMCAAISHTNQNILQTRLALQC